MNFLKSAIKKYLYQRKYGEAAKLVSLTERSEFCIRKESGARAISIIESKRHVVLSFVRM